MNNTRENRIASCKCEREKYGQEARIYRIYDAEDILAGARSALKGVVVLSRHIQEVRLTLGVGHRMDDLAIEMIERAKGIPLGQRGNWWQNNKHDEKGSCSAQFETALEQSCDLTNVGDCPE